MTRHGDTLLVNLLMAGGLFVLAISLPLPMFLVCTHPLAQRLVIALGAAILILLLLRAAAVKAPWLQPYQRWIVIYSVTIVLALWLGSYSYSPLGFSDGRIPVLRGFIVTRPARGLLHIASGETITLGRASLASFQVITLPGPVKCLWASANGGALDDPYNCDVVYAPPVADYDVLNMQIQPGCNLPAARGRINISLLP